MYAARHPSIGDIVDLEMPAGMVTRPVAGSGTPTGTGAGGGAPDPRVKPDADPHAKPDADPGGGPDVDPAVPGTRPDADADVDVDAKGKDVADAERDWHALDNDSRPYKGKFTEMEFRARYAEGWRYDLDKRKWYDATGGKRKKPRAFGEDDDGARIFNKLAGEKSKSSFKPYVEMLIREGLADEAAIIGILDGLRKVSRDENYIRHEFKELYRDRVRKRILNPDPAEMLRRHPDLFPDGKPGPVPLEAKHREMRRHLAGLNSKDMGNLAEVWYRQVHAPDSEPQIAIKQSEMAKQGIAIDGDRSIDLLDAHTAREIKFIQGKLSKRDIAEFDDLIKLRGAEVSARGKDFVLDEVQVVFMHHKGGIKNLEWARTQLKANEGKLSFEFFNAKGERSSVIRSASELDDSFLKWLGESP